MGPRIRSGGGPARHGPHPRGRAGGDVRWAPARGASQVRCAQVRCANPLAPGAFPQTADPHPGAELAAKRPARPARQARQAHSASPLGPPRAPARGPPTRPSRLSSSPQHPGQHTHTAAAARLRGSRAAARERHRPDPARRRPCGRRVPLPQVQWGRKKKKKGAARARPTRTDVAAAPLLLGCCLSCLALVGSYLPGQHDEKEPHT